jgi:magnesium-transporting ATPase (P-type)
MITGDNKGTAMAIAKEVGILDNYSDIVLTGEELNKMSDSEVCASLSNLKIVARAMPNDKSRLVNLAKKMNLVVGMTGDGVNDAIALKRADVGFSMGNGTEVAKEASDIVIMDDNILSISKAILYGRTIFKSIRKFIIFQLTINFCAVSVSVIGPFIGIQYPVTVIQMLWINMVMDTLAGLAFSYEPALIEYMKELPKKRDEKINSHLFLKV